MKQVTINIYSFSELSEDAKKVALQEWVKGLWEDGYHWDNENAESLKKFCDLFNVRIWSNNNVMLDENDEVRELSGVRLMAYLWNNYGNSLFNKKTYRIGKKIRKSKIELDNNCVLTGYCMDDAILQPVYNAMNKPYEGTFEDLINECIAEYEKALQNDRDYQETIEYFEDHAESNEFEFYENGTRY